MAVAVTAGGAAAQRGLPHLLRPDQHKATHLLLEQRVQHRQHSVRIVGAVHANQRQRLVHRLQRGGEQRGARTFVGRVGGLVCGTEAPHGPAGALSRRISCAALKCAGAVVSPAMPCRAAHTHRARSCDRLQHAQQPAGCEGVAGVNVGHRLSSGGGLRRGHEAQLRLA